MATTVISNTWQEAFDSHSIANVRAFEKQLRAGALRDKEKLRVIVGSNYRDLLETAEQIVHLNIEARDVESNISSLSQACRPPAFQSHSSAIPQKIKLTGQLKFLDQLLQCASRSVKQHAVLLASKMLVIARPLLKHIEDGNGVTTISKWSQTRLKSTRSQLVNRINKIMLKPSSSPSQLIQCAAAYCLLTSSSSTDAVKHFQNLRLQRLSVSHDVSDHGRDLKQSCHYLIDSAVSIRVLAGRSLVDMLNDIQKRPVLASDEVQSLETLQLDIYQDLLPQDILTFVPYFKRNTPSKAELQTNLEQWIGEAVKHILRRIQATLAGARLLKTLKTRQEVFEILLPNLFTSALSRQPIKSIHDSFSEAINLRIEQLAEEIDILGKKLITLTGAKTSSSLWISDLSQISSRTTSSAYLHKIQREHLGITGDLQQCIRSLSHWSRRVQTSQEAIQAISKTKWHDKLEDYDDENEDTAHELMAALTQEDAQAFTTKLKECLQQKSKLMAHTVNEYTTSMVAPLSSEQDSANSSQVPTMLRAIREIKGLLKLLLPANEFPALNDAASRLIARLSQQVADEMFQSRTETSITGAASSFVADDLPSPLAISFLQKMCLLMLKRGGHDLWSTTAVRQLSSVVLEHITAEENKSAYMASEFDEHYLRVALGSKPAEGLEMKGDTTHRKANLYWNRTRTLFGILNV